MGTSMKEPVAASSTVESRKNRLNRPSSKRHASLNPKENEFKIFVHKARPVSQLSRLEGICEPIVLSKEEKQHEYTDEDDTPAFKTAYSERYLECDLTKKSTKKQTNSKKLDGKIQQTSELQDNYYALPSTLSAKQSQSNQLRQFNAKIQDELDLCINSKLQCKQEGYFADFFPAINSNILEYEGQSFNKRQQTNKKTNMLLQMMIIEHKKTGNLLEKYLPKSKLPSKEVPQALTSSQTKIHKRNYYKRSQYFPVENPEQGSAKKVEKYYANWKKRVSSRKRQYNESPKTDNKQKEPSQYYDLTKKPFKLSKRQEEIKEYQNRLKISELAKKRRKQRSVKLFRSKEESRMSFTSIKSEQSIIKVKVVHF